MDESADVAVVRPLLILAEFLVLWRGRGWGVRAGPEMSESRSPPLAPGIRVRCAIATATTAAKHAS